jgi:hypothetical protein
MVKVLSLNKTLLQCRRPLQTPGPRRGRPLVSRAKLADHGRVRSTQQDSAGGQQLAGYIKYLNDSVDFNQAPFSIGGETSDGANLGSSASEDDTDGGSQTEAEAEEVRTLISELQDSNVQLQTEMNRLVSGLSDLLQNIKTTSKSDKALLAALPAALLRANQQNTNCIATSPPPQRGLRPAPVVAGTQGVDEAVNVSCVMQHPGALCCTRSTVREDPIGRAITITMETTARATDDATARGLLTDEELGGLAAQALLSSAAEHLCSRTRTINAHARPQSEKERHDELCAILQSGEIIEATSNPVVSQFGHESFVVNIQDEVTGKRLRALFKPRIEGDADGWHRAPMEWAAYRLNLLLGLDYVPPVAYRTGGVTFTAKVDNENEKQVSYAEGAFLYFVEDAHQLRCFPEKQWGNPPEPKDLLLSNTRILDTLLHNSDRHHGHFLLGRHWCKGSYSGDRWLGELRPVLIDHAASFRAEAEVNMTHENAFRTGPVRCVSANTYLRLRFLDYSALAGEFRGVLTEEELRFMVRRRDSILRYLDALVAEQGYAATVIDS